MANKLVVDEEIFLQNKNLNLTTNLEKLTINVKGKCLINDLNNKIENLTINLQANSSLVYNRFRLNALNSKLVITQSENAKLIYKEAIKSSKNFNYQIISNLNENEAQGYFYLRIISEEVAQAKIDVLGKITKDIQNVNLLEDLRGLILNDSKLSIIPNMEVFSNNVSANHNVVIGTINQEELLYLTSKGLKESKALELLIKAFILSIFDNKLKEIIKKYL